MSDDRGGDGDDDWTDDEWRHPDEIGSTTDLRRTATLVLAGLVLPLATVVFVVLVTGAYELPWIVPFLVLIAGPPIGLSTMAVALVQSGYGLPLPEWVPVPHWVRSGRNATLGQRLPDHQRDAFARETLAAEAGGPADDRIATLATLLALYLVAVPVHALLIWLAAGL